MACTISFTRNVTRSCARVTSTGNVLRPKFKANSQAEALRLCRLVMAALAQLWINGLVLFGMSVGLLLQAAKRLSKMTV